MRPRHLPGSYKIESPVDETSCIGRFVGGSGLIVAVLGASVLLLFLGIQSMANRDAFSLPVQLEASE